MAREIKMITGHPPPGVQAWPEGDSMERIAAELSGPESSPYEGGIFRVQIEITPRYPFEPPKARFLTPVYHPNIDSAGRICLDTLKMPPKGSWKPSVNIITLLSTIRLLLASPNGDDGLMAEITRQFCDDRAAFEEEARRWTKEHACGRTLDTAGTASRAAGKAPAAASAVAAAAAAGMRPVADDSSSSSSSSSDGESDESGESDGDAAESGHADCAGEGSDRKRAAPQGQASVASDAKRGRVA